MQAQHASDLSAEARMWAGTERAEPAFASTTQQLALPSAAVHPSASSHAGFALRIRQLWSGNEPDWCAQIASAGFWSGTERAEPAFRPALNAGALRLAALVTS